MADNGERCLRMVWVTHTYHQPQKHLSYITTNGELYQTNIIFYHLDIQTASSTTTRGPHKLQLDVSHGDDNGEPQATTTACDNSWSPAPLTIVSPSPSRRMGCLAYQTAGLINSKWLHGFHFTIIHHHKMLRWFYFLTIIYQSFCSGFWKSRSFLSVF